MQRCCILGCQNYNCSNTASIIYFKFPLNDRILLEKWLKQIGRKNWYPSEDDQICSIHFQKEDISNESEICHYLKSTAIPTIFCSQAMSLPPNYMWTNFHLEPMVEIDHKTSIDKTIDRLQLIPNVKPEKSHQSKGIRQNIQKVTPITVSQFTKILQEPKYNELIAAQSNVTSTFNNSDKSTMKKVSDSTIPVKVPVLKITINKKYNVPSTMNTKCNNKHRHMPNIINNLETVRKVNIEDSIAELKPSVTQQVQNIVALQKPLIFNLIPVISEKPIKRKSTTLDIKTDLCIPKTAYTRKGDLSRDNSRNQTSGERLRYLYTKAQRDCNILRIRLRALRERHKQEKEEIKKLQRHLGGFSKNHSSESYQVSKSNLKRKKVSMVSENSEKEDEYEKLLREVRKIKDMLSEKYPVTENKRPEEATHLLYPNKTVIKRRPRNLIKYNNSSKVKNIESMEEIDVIYNNCNDVTKTANGQPHVLFKSDNNNILCFEEEYLDPLFIDV